jgi:ABC-type long-subunit fatty acid transport system fused permease/ATPase subunit
MCGGNQSTRRKPPTCSKSLIEEEVGVDKNKQTISLIAIIPIVQDLSNKVP